MAFEDIKVYLSPLDVMPEHHAERARQELVDMFRDICDEIVFEHREPRQPAQWGYSPRDYKFLQEYYAGLRQH